MKQEFFELVAYSASAAPLMSKTRVINLDRLREEMHLSLALDKTRM
jgi:hypothetical protein